MWHLVAIEFIRELWKNNVGKDTTKAFRFMFLLLLALTLGGQMDIKKSVEVTRVEVLNEIQMVREDLKESKTDQKLALKEYHDRQRETEGRLSFLEASTGTKNRWQHRRNN